ncbi:hypothetical protein CEV31_1377 [Brucella thiophenivorans]|uniref:Uncharacterized protein n=1 Tax=Brucella thiophenivorans TaxID=571255 RepID=A0A256FYW5_9HYPH|nr:hypothetical protein CEV31_1377 [Brucella thiophenivorans]
MVSEAQSEPASNMLFVLCYFQAPFTNPDTVPKHPTEYVHSSGFSSNFPSRVFKVNSKHMTGKFAAHRSFM